MNNKGFMMAEVVVVSAIILVTLTSLYVSYNKIITAYNQRVNYYDVRTLYELANYRDNSLDEEVPSNSPVSKDGNNVIYHVSKEVIEDNTLNVTNQTFRDYLDYLSSSLDFDNMNVDSLLVMERCLDEDNCKYAYLEVLDETSVIAPECTLSVSGTVITASVNEEENLSYIGWDTNRVSDNGVMTKNINKVGTYTFFVENNDGHVGSCSLEVVAANESVYSCSSGYTLSGTTCSKTEYKDASVSYSCSCGKTDAGLCSYGYTFDNIYTETACESHCTKKYSKECGYYFKKNYSCGSWTKYNTSKCKKTTTKDATLEPASCASEYSLANDNYCYKIN